MIKQLKNHLVSTPESLDSIAERDPSTIVPMLQASNFTIQLIINIIEAKITSLEADKAKSTSQAVYDIKISVLKELIG